jgi:hypothetical protein
MVLLPSCRHEDTGPVSPVTPTTITRSDTLAARGHRSDHGDVTPADHRKRQPGLRGLLGVLAIGLAVAAVVKELRLPPGERTWHGSVAGFVPYDFRAPTLERARERLWSPESPRLLVPRVFGVGWTVNVGRVVALLRGAATRERG